MLSVDGLKRYHDPLIILFLYPKINFLLFTAYNTKNNFIIMKKINKNQCPVNFSYIVYVHLKTVGDSKEKIRNFSSKMEFNESCPLVAREKAFEYILDSHSNFESATQVGMINLASFEEAQQNGFKNFTAFSYTIIFDVTDNNGNTLYHEPISYEDSEEEMILGLTEEYSYYEDYGFDTGEEMVLETGETILFTDSFFTNGCI
jgi:hypothetical protein